MNYYELQTKSCTTFKVQSVFKQSYFLVCEACGAKWPQEMCCYERWDVLMIGWINVHWYQGTVIIVINYHFPITMIIYYILIYIILLCCPSSEHYTFSPVLLTTFVFYIGYVLYYCICIRSQYFTRIAKDIFQKYQPHQSFLQHPYFSGFGPLGSPLSVCQQREHNALRSKFHPGSLPAWERHPVDEETKDFCH